METWQNQLDEVLKFDTTCATRRKNTIELIKNTRAILGDVTTAVRERDVKKIAPPNLAYGKNIQGMQALRRQVLSDIIPGTITKGIPRVVEETPNIVRGVTRLVRSLPQKGKAAIGYIRDISEDPSMLQFNLDILKEEIRNTVKSTPQAAYTPYFEVVKTTDNYQIRSYLPYFVCSTALRSGEGNEMADSFALGSSFTLLANYVLGEGQFYFTTPIICSTEAMEFVLPEDVGISNPPTSDAIRIKEVPSEVVAVREFPGFATDGEVSRQRAMLEDALLADGIGYDNLSFRVFIYNPPQTIPWLRRNEVVIKILTGLSPSVPPIL